jgi:hypothetical protein
VVLWVGSPYSAPVGRRREVSRSLLIVIGAMARGGCVAVNCLRERGNGVGEVSVDELGRPLGGVSW